MAKDAMTRKSYENTGKHRKNKSFFGAGPVENSLLILREGKEG